MPYGLLSDGLLVVFPALMLESPATLVMIYDLVTSLGEKDKNSAYFRSKSTYAHSIGGKEKIKQSLCLGLKEFCVRKDLFCILSF